MNAWETWCAITDEAECAPDAPLEVVWKRLRARGSERTFAEVADAEAETKREHNSDPLKQFKTMEKQ